MAQTKKPTTLEQLKLLAQRTKEELAERDAKIQEIVTAGGEPNKIDVVKVNGAALTIANKIVDILIATGAGNGTIKVNNVDVAVKGLAALAYKANVSESDLADALKTTIANKASQTDLDTVSGKVNTLVGSDTGKSARTIANEELAKQLIADGADAALDTLQEIAAWIQEHPDDVSAMNKDIEQNASDIDALVKLVGTIPAGAEATDVIGYITEAINDWDETIQNRKYVDETTLGNKLGNFETQGFSSVTEMVSEMFGDLDNRKVDAVTGKGLSTNDYTTAEKNKLAGITAGANKVEASASNGYMKIDGVEKLVYEEPVDVLHGTWAADTEVNSMLTEVFGS